MLAVSAATQEHFFQHLIEEARLTLSAAVQMLLWTKHMIPLYLLSHSIKTTWLCPALKEQELTDLGKALLLSRADQFWPDSHIVTLLHTEMVNL